MSTLSVSLPARLTGPGLAIGLALGAVYLIWSTTFLGIAFALRGFPPFLLSGGRYLAAAGILALVALALRHARPSAREAGAAAFLGLFFVAIGNGVLTWAEQYVATGTCALLGAIAPLCLLGLEAVLPGFERPTRRGALGVLAGFAGVVLLVGMGGAGSSSGLVAQLALVASAALSTIGLLLAKRLTTPASWAWNSAATMGGGGAAMALVGLAAGEGARLDLAAVPAEAWAGFWYLVVFGSCVGFSAFAFLTRAARPALVSTISYVIPVLATLLGAVVLAEPVTATTVAAATLIVGSVALVATGGRQGTAV